MAGTLKTNHTTSNLLVVRGIEAQPGHVRHPNEVRRTKDDQAPSLCRPTNKGAEGTRCASVRWQGYREQRLLNSNL